MIRKTFFILLLIFLFGKINSQCFTSPGNPIGGNVNMGVVNKNMFRVSSFYKYSYSGRYFFGDELYTEEKGKTFKYAYYNYVGAMIAYGITNRLTFETEFGYFINKTRAFATAETGYGPSNALLTAKYQLYNNTDSRFEITAGAGGKIPLRHSAQINDGIVLAPEAQSSAGAYGLVAQSYIIKEFPFQAIRIFFISQYEHNLPSTPDYYEGKKYSFGDALTVSLFFTKHLHLPPALDWLSQNWTVILQLRNERKGKNEFISTDVENPQWIEVPNSGSSVYFASPQLNYTLNSVWNISVTFDIPIYQHYEMKQMATDYAFNINLSKDIDLSGKYIPKE